jgi:hypothetical protein
MLGSSPSLPYQILLSRNISPPVLLRPRFLAGFCRASHVRENILAQHAQIVGERENGPAGKKVNQAVIPELITAANYYRGFD